MTKARSKAPVTLIGCGILGKEIACLVEKNAWPVTPCLLPSSLHMDFNKLGNALEKALLLHEGKEKALFYGACHPLMQRFLERAQTVRTPGQNCVEIYLGPELFARELAAGAFFLFEEWAQKWNEVTSLAFGDSPAVMREIFASAHTYLLAIRTPCSGDFAREAEEVSRNTGLELRWLDAGLEQLEGALAKALQLGGRGDV